MQVHRWYGVKLLGVGQGGIPTPLPQTTINAVKGKSLYVDVLVGRVPTRFLVDSGAEVSIIPDTHELVSKGGGMRLPQLQPVLADGSKLNVRGIVTLPIEVDQKSITTDFYVVNSHISPILGSDVMRRFAFVKLDFDGQTVKFGPKVSSPVPDARTDPPRVSRVVMSENLVVPSCREVLVHGLVLSESPADLAVLADQSCILEPDLKRDEDCLGVARVLGVVRDGKFPVRICNPYPHDLELRKHQRLGNLEAIEEPVIGVLSEDEDGPDCMN